MDEFDAGSTEKVSKFHGAFDQLRRIDALCAMAHRDVRSGNYQNWNTCLDRLWMEFVGDLDIENEKDMQTEEDFDKINKELVGLFPLFSTMHDTWNKKPADFIQKKSKQYLILSGKEIFLRRLQNKLGKGTAWRDESEDDFE